MSNISNPLSNLRVAVRDSLDCPGENVATTILTYTDLRYLQTLTRSVMSARQDLVKLMESDTASSLSPARRNRLRALCEMLKEMDQR